METDFAGLLAALAVCVALDLAALVGALTTKRRTSAARAEREAAIRGIRAALLDRDGSALLDIAQRAPRVFALVARATLESCRDDRNALRMVKEALAATGGEGAALRGARAARFNRRIRAYLELGLRGSGACVEALMGALPRESRALGRLAILRQLALSESPPPVRDLLDAIDRLDGGLREAEVAALSPLGPRLQRHFESAGPPGSDAGLRLYLEAVKARPTRSGWEGASRIAEERDDELGLLAAKVLAEAFPPSWFLKAYRRREEPRFMVPCARLLGAELGPEDAAELDPWFLRHELREAGMAAAAEIDRRFPERAEAFLDAIESGGPERASALSAALEHRLPYFAFHSPSPPRPGLLRMLSCLLDGSRTGAVLSALEAPLPEAARADLLGSVRDALSERPSQRAFFSRHANPRLLEELEIPPPPPEENRPRIPVTVRDKAFIGFLVLAALCVFPAIFFMRWRGSLPYLSRSEILYRFIFDFHFLFAYYTLAVNFFYLALAALSAVKLRAQALIWESGLSHLLFSSGILPSVTIIAPAYNEERTIADSVESLLSLAYPDYQVVVVNDGSADGTMAEAIRAFGLEPASPGTAGDLPCMPVRTVYRSRLSPNLLVVDKANGGKADALNAGLNHSRGEYVCCIDADSLLEPQALLRAMLQALARDREVVAIGGNILPVNGSAVDHGHLQRVAMPDAPLAAFQTIEYLRSFVAGRLGWALVDGLLIISGAFGLFRKDRVLEARGYMTGKGDFRKDTVGEDMELVVRLVRNEREKGRRGTVDYCYNANCWTEVPEEGTALSKQRDRWHRGLIEVLLQHRSMAFRPRIGASGVFSIPYFYLFELVGPWLEFSGYIVLAASLAFALIDPLVSLTVFGIAVSFGIMISLAAVLLAERGVVRFEPKELRRLVLLAFAENFGFRQVMSMSRVLAFAQFFYKSKGWQKLARKGFSRSKGQA